MEYATMRKMNPGALVLERRGCNFASDDPIGKYSDVGNWRIYTEFTTADGVEVCGDFGRGYTYDTKGKTPKITNDHALHADLCRYDNNGSCWAYRLGVDGKNYTIADILDSVNAVSAEKYNSVIWAETIESTTKPNENFTPAGKLVEWAKKYKIDYEYQYGEIVLLCAFGRYKYHHYEIGRTLCDGTQELRFVMVDA